MKQILQIDNALRLVPIVRSIIVRKLCLVSGCELGLPRRWGKASLQSRNFGSHVFLFDQHGELLDWKSRRRENGFQLGMLHYLRIIFPL